MIASMVQFCQGKIQRLLVAHDATHATGTVLEGKTLGMLAKIWLDLDVLIAQALGH